MQKKETRSSDEIPNEGKVFAAGGCGVYLLRPGLDWPRWSLCWGMLGLSIDLNGGVAAAARAAARASFVCAFERRGRPNFLADIVVRLSYLFLPSGFRLDDRFLPGLVGNLDLVQSQVSFPPIYFGLSQTKLIDKLKMCEGI